MNQLIKFVLPILVLAVCFVATRAVIANRPEPQKRPQFKSTTSIDATRVSLSDYPVIVHTQGLVGAAREGSLVPEVAGTIKSVSANFVVGGAFEAGEIIVEIDDRDYQIALTLAEASYAQSAATLEEEKARSLQAADDWKRLGRSGKPSALTLRKPQLAAARASLEGARAQVQRAQLDLERTRIVAPYRGRVRTKNVDLGQFVNKGSQIAAIYSIDTAEIRLPLTNNQLGFVELPSKSSVLNERAVTLRASIGGTEQQWSGQIVRTEGAIDPDSRQLFAVAQVDNPYQSGDMPLRIGQYVRAEVTGKILKNVIVIPRSALREDREVLLVDELNTLQKRDVKVVWKDADVAVVKEGLKPGDVISLTSLGTVTNGSRVKASVDGQPATSEQSTGSAPASADERDKRLQKIKAMIDSGQDLPAAIRDRISARIADGKPVPDWLKAHIEKTAK